MSRMRFGVLSFTRAPYDELLRIWRAVEEAGFDGAWLDDDLALPGMGDFEAWTVLGALARETTRLRIGTLVSVITFRHPALLAAQALTIDHLSGGRLELGFGSGGPGNAYALLGLDEWSPGERAERLEEQVAILDRLLRGEAIDHDGRHYRTRATSAALIVPVQRPRPPLTLAAHGERGLRLAARHADGWNSLGGQPYVKARDASQRVTLDAAVAETRRLGERLDAHCRALGRDPATLRRSILAYWAVPDPFSSLDAFDEYVGRYRAIGIDEIVFYWPPLTSIGGRRAVSAEEWARFERIAAERIAPHAAEAPRPTGDAATG